MGTDGRAVLLARLRRALLGLGPQLGPLAQLRIRVLQPATRLVQLPHRLLGRGQLLLDQRDRALSAVGQLGGRALRGLRCVALGERAGDPVGVLPLQPGGRRGLGGAGQRAVLGPFGGLGAGPRGAQPGGVPGHLGLGPGAVGLGALGVPGGALGQCGGLLQLAGAAHLGPGAQGLVLGPQAGTPPVQLLQPGFGLGQCGAGGLELLVGGVQFGAQRLVAGVLRAGRAGLAPGGHPGVAAVVLEEARRGALGGRHDRQLLLLLVQRAERLGDIGDDRLVHRRQRLGQRLGERLLAGALGQLRLAQLHQQVHQRRVALFAETEQRLVHRPAVRPGRVVHQPAPVQGLGQPVAGDRRPGGVEQPESAVGRVGADLAGIDDPAVMDDSAVGDEVPVPRDAPAADCLQSATEGGVAGVAVLVEAAELDPAVAEALGVRVLAAEQQVPLHPLLRIGVRLDPVRGEVAVQQERQGQREHLGLAGAVVATEQQPAVAEVELLDVVVEEVDQADPQRLPAGAARRRQRRLDGGAHRVPSFLRFAVAVLRALGALRALWPGSSSTVSPTR